MCACFSSIRALGPSQETATSEVLHDTASSISAISCPPCAASCCWGWQPRTAPPQLAAARSEQSCMRCLLLRAMRSAARSITQHRSDAHSSRAAPRSCPASTRRCLASPASAASSRVCHRCHRRTASQPHRRRPAQAPTPRSSARRVPARCASWRRTAVRCCTNETCRQQRRQTRRTSAPRGLSGSVFRQMCSSRSRALAATPVTALLLPLAAARRRWRDGGWCADVNASVRDWFRRRCCAWRLR